MWSRAGNENDETYPHGGHGAACPGRAAGGVSAAAELSPGDVRPAVVPVRGDDAAALRPGYRPLRLWVLPARGPLPLARAGHPPAVAPVPPAGDRLDGWGRRAGHCGGAVVADHA